MQLNVFLLLKKYNMMKKVMFIDIQLVLFSKSLNIKFEVDRLFFIT